MNYDLLWKIGEQVRGGEGLSPDEKRFVTEIIPVEWEKFPKVPLPSRVRHPGGFSISGTPVRTLTQCTLVLSAQRVLGARYDARSEFYRRVAMDLAFGIMRSHFHHDHPKGAYCCAQCTLAVYPVLEANALRWFDGRNLAKDIRRLIEKEQWRFSGSANAGMVAWALG